MPKSVQAFRTISEVADDLDIQKHVLRFWESKFAQLKPMKRGGGRRYYRPEDVALLRGIHHLLRSQSYTIKGVQKILREQGVDFVKDCWQSGAAQPTARGAAARGRKREVAAVESPPAPAARASTRKSDARSDAATAGPTGSPQIGAEERGAIESAVEQLESARATLTKTRKRPASGATSASATPSTRSRKTTKRS